MATNYKRARRKTALITTTLAIVTILAIAVTGTVVFLKDRGTTEAAELQENEQQVSNQTSTGNETNVTNENIEPEVAGAQNGAEVITDTETGTTGTQTGTQTGAQTGTTTGAQTGVQTGTQTGAQAGTTTDTIQEATIIRTETVEIPEKQISEGHYVGWTPIDVEAELASAKINTQIPNLKVEKTAYTKSGKNLAKQGEEIVYVIKITSDKELKAIEVKDLIPVGTKYVSASDNGREVSENGIVKGIIWSVDLTEKNNDGLYEANVKLTVKVNDDQTGIIENIAIANGESSEDEDGNGTRTAVIETSKTSTINRNNQIVKEPAKVGDEITYTISVVNTGEIAGTTKIKDVDLEKLLGDGKAELVGNIKLYEGNDIKNNNIDKVQLINGINDVDVPAGKEVKVVFTIKLNKVLGKIINTATIGEDGTETDEIDTLNVDVQKEVKEIKRNGVVVNEPVKVGDVIYYNITIENTGSIDQNVEVKDVLANNQRELELYNEETIVKEVTVNAGDKIVLTANYIVEQDDIDAQKVLTNVATIKYDNEEKTSDVTTEVEKQNQSYIATKTADKEKVSKAGEEITYTITVTNTGNVTLKGIPVKDEMIGLDTTIESLEVGGVRPFTGKYEVKQSDIDKGGVIKNVATVGDKTPEVETKIEKTLTVIPTTASTERVPQKVILVLDFSGSMDDPVGTGRDKVKKIISLKAAVNTFLTSYCNGINQVKIITYSTNAMVSQDWTTNKDTAYNSISSKNANGGTNIDAALTLANTGIDSDTNIILMTDGLPTYYLYTDYIGKERIGGDGHNTTEDTKNHAINAATLLKNNGAKIFTIGFGLNTNESKTFLQNVATPESENNKYYYESMDGNALAKAFDDIFKSITEDGKPIEFTSSDGYVNINSGFEYGQKIEIYTGSYEKGISEPFDSISWVNFMDEDSGYAEYTDNVIKFNIEKYMMEYNIDAGEKLIIRFVNDELTSNTNQSVSSASLYALLLNNIGKDNVKTTAVNALTSNIGETNKEEIKAEKDLKPEAVEEKEIITENKTVENTETIEENNKIDVKKEQEEIIEINTDDQIKENVEVNDLVIETELITSNNVSEIAE